MYERGRLQLCSPGLHLANRASTETPGMYKRERPVDTVSAVREDLVAAH